MKTSKAYIIKYDREDDIYWSLTVNTLTLKEYNTYTKPITKATALRFITYAVKQPTFDWRYNRISFIVFKE